MTILIALLVAPFLLLTTCFAIEVLVGLRPLSTSAPQSADRVRAVVVVPAHDEERGLRANLERLKLAASDQASILVVADNCSDRTAQIGRELGVDVIERRDPGNRGKGFALDFAKTYLSGNPPDAVIVVDADCLMDAGSLGRLITACSETQRPCQAINLQRPRPNASPGVQLSTFAFFIKNVIRQRALTRLAGRVHLLGTGMVFPWRVFDRMRLATGNIVEDLRLGQDLADAGHSPLLIEDATVWSNAESDANTISQRSRWEGGFLQNAFQVGPKMIRTAVERASPRLLWAAVNTIIPPFALLMLLDVVILLIVGLVSWATSASLWPLFLQLGTMMIAAIALALAWVRGGSDFVPLSGLVRAPLYIAWKLPIYLGFARHGAPKEWLRTGRE